MPNIERMMPAASDKGKPMARKEASDNGSQPYSCPLGDREMAGMGLPPIQYSLPLGRRHALPKGKV